MSKVEQSNLPELQENTVDPRAMLRGQAESTLAELINRNQGNYSVLCKKKGEFTKADQEDALDHAAVGNIVYVLKAK
jgi:hypothetical protein